MKASDITQPLLHPFQMMSKEGERLAKKSGQQVNWRTGSIRNSTVDNDPWKLLWARLKPGDRLPQFDFFSNTWVKDWEEAMNPGSQAEQEQEHEADEANAEQGHRHEDLRREPLTKSERSEGRQLDRRRKRLRSSASEDVDLRQLRRLLNEYFQEEESEEYHANDSKRSVGRDAGKCTECRLPDSPSRRGYSTSNGWLV